AVLRARSSGARARARRSTGGWACTLAPPAAPTLRAASPSQRRHFAIDLDRPPGGGELLEQLVDPGQARHGMREQALQEAGIGRLRVDHVAYACLEVLASGVDAPEHDPVAEDEVEVDLVGRDL